MKPAESLLPRVLAAVVLLVSVSVLAPLLTAAVELARGAAIPPIRWAFPLLILAVGSALIWILSKRQVPIQLFALAFALWMLVAGFYWFGGI